MHSFDTANDCYSRTAFGSRTVWQSREIDISNSPPLDIKATIAGLGNIDVGDVVKLMYRIDSGALVTADTDTGASAPTIVLETSGGFNGDWLWVYVELNTSATTESLCIQSVTVTETDDGGNNIPTPTPTPLPTPTPVPGALPWVEDFTELGYLGATQWTASGGGAHGIVTGPCYQRTGSGTETLITTERIFLTPGRPVDIAVNATSAGGLEASGISRDYVELRYSLDGAALVVADFAEGSFGSDVLRASGLDGSTLDVVVAMDVSNTDEYLCIPQISVSE